MASPSTTSPEQPQPARRRRARSTRTTQPPPASARGRILPAPPAPPPVGVGPAPPPIDMPVRRRRIVVGLAAEAAEQAERRRNGMDVRGPPLPARRRRAPAAPAGHHSGAGSEGVIGTCPCGLPARALCGAGCGRPTCEEHFGSGQSRLSAGAGQRSEREHTAYLRAFSAGATPRCAWCRAQAGEAAVAALRPAPALPADVVERLRELLRHPHDHPREAWDTTVRDHGGAAVVVRLLGPRLSGGQLNAEFRGRRRHELLAGVAITRAGWRGACEVVDGAGSVWSVRPVEGVGRRRRAWTWEPVSETRVAMLLPRIVELAR